MKLGGKKSKSLRYMIDITGKDPLSLGELGGGLILEKTEKMRQFSYEGVIGSK